MSAAAAAAAVRDPELRVLTIADLGILRDVTVHEGRVSVTITPTWARIHDFATRLPQAVEVAIRRRGAGA